MSQGEGSYNEKEKTIKRLTRNGKKLIKPNIEYNRFGRVNNEGMTVEEIHAEELNFANIAIQAYNEDKGTDFEVLELVAYSYDLVEGYENVREGFWHHLNFKAMSRKNIRNGLISASSDDFSPTLFFAEVRRGQPLFGPPRYHHVQTCSVLEPYDPDIVIGCGFCSSESNVRHPVKEFTTGHWPYEDLCWVSSDDESWDEL